MLEIKNLTKIYQTKNVITKALDNVSLKFPDKGMVFLLGKSGSGKSTLLNVCGGLDTPTQGEIIVKGRSSNTFSNSDFDSYRNTYIGFIFQEYNILNEFSVEDNIALALELQGQPKDVKKINELLRQVDLTEFAKRKPNTLSGGQKQRIAIARALIKNPEIIMADEPTGALDSATGRQVLDTLKKLSKTKLVIVVSHDREFAEYYGDRIIELKDGKVISDISKTLVDAKQVGSITMIDDNTISINNGEMLSSDEINVIIDFLKSSRKEILISNNQKEIIDFKKQFHISDNGSKETFVDTDENQYEFKSYSKDDAILIRSKLPLRHAIKIGVSSLKLKPIRLLLTIILSIVSFVFLGIVSTMTFYNESEVAIESIIKSEMVYIPIKKGYNLNVTYSYDDYTYEYNDIISTLFSDNDIDQIKTKYGNDVIAYYNFNRCPNLGENISFNTFPIVNAGSTNNNFYAAELTNFAYVDESNSIRKRIICGTYPENDDEIMITSYLFDSLKNIGLRGSKGENIALTNYNDIINKTIDININGTNISFKVSGVYNVDDLIPEKYKSTNDNNQYDFYYNWIQERQTGIFSLCLVSENFYNANVDSIVYNSMDIGTYTDASIKLNKQDYEFSTIAKFNETKVYGLNGNIMTRPNDKDIAVSLEFIGQLIYNYLSLTDEDFVIGFNNREYDSLTNQFKPSINDYLYIFLYGVNYDDESEESMQMYSIEERIEAWNKVYHYFEEANRLDVFNNISMDQPDFAGESIVNIAGFTFSKADCIIMSNDLYNKYMYKAYQKLETNHTNYIIDNNAIYSGVLIYNNKQYARISNLIDETKYLKQDDSVLIFDNPLMNSLYSVSNFIQVLSSVFLWAGIILAIFATLLLFNFITVSIINKKREIGILRAVGARSLDVFKIFFSESIVIVLISCISAILISAIVCNNINNTLGDSLSGVRILAFGFPSIILITLISIVVSLLSTFLPVYSIAKKKPVDSIRSI